MTPLLLTAIMLLTPVAEPESKPVANTATAKSALSRTELFQRAMTAYTRAKNIHDYTKAAELFNALVDRGIKHEELYYNLGNAYYKAGQYGYAVYNYERALKIYPGHKNARYNLSLTQKLIQSRFKDSVVSFGENPFWIKAVTWLHHNTLLIAFFIFWVLLFAMLTYLWFAKPSLLKIGVITAAVIIGCFTSVFGLLLAGRTYYEKAFKYAIVLPDELPVRAAPQNAANTSFKLHSGLRVRLGSEERAWIKISLPNGMEGWVPKNKVGPL